MESNNIYILYCQSIKIERICYKFNQYKQFEAFIPKYEKYIRSINQVVLKDMYPNYLFIKTNLNQIEFDSMLNLMNEDKDGVIRELKKEDVSALTNAEMSLLNQLLNDQYILQMSEGYKANGHTIVTKGPLLNLQQHIISVNTKDMYALLNIEFLSKKVKAGIWIKKT
ncbi:MAG: hypothetical protein LUH02_01305 [Erysipelotrichaceae bacterium]|nr:hypothetical protein [Erysipelotrichaceae bacterium]